MVYSDNKYNDKLEPEIAENLLFLIDLDNTLFFTDRANNLAYEKAIKDMLNPRISNELFEKLYMLSSGRITKDTFYESSLSKEYPFLNNTFNSFTNSVFSLFSENYIKCLNEINNMPFNFVDAISDFKNKLYKDFLFAIKDNTISIFELISRIIEDNKQKYQHNNYNLIKIIVTNANQDRVCKILEYYGLGNKFEHIIFCNGAENKYKIASKEMEKLLIDKDIPMKYVYIFDDDKNQIIKAKSIFREENVFQVYQI